MTTDRSTIGGEREQDPSERVPRRRLDEVFGDVLPESTSDDIGTSPGRSRDEELLRDVPPHHG